MRLELAASLPDRLRADPAVAELGAALTRLGLAGERTAAREGLVALVRWTRSGGGAIGAGAGEPGPVQATGRLRLLLSLLERSAPLRQMVGRAVDDLLFRADAVALFGEVGLPTQRGFFAELAERFAEQLLPRPRDVADLAVLLGRLLRRPGDLVDFSRLPLPLVERLAALLAPPGSEPRWAAVRAGLADGFRLVHARVEAEGLAPKLRARGRKQPVAGSPYFALREAGEALLAAWTAGREIGAAAHDWRLAAAACREEMAAVERALEEEGVSVDVVFGLEVLGAALDRLAAMVELMEAPPGERRAAAVQRLVVELATAGQRERSVGHLVRTNLRLLHRKIVERSGATGEKYVARNRREYAALAFAAVGGGLLTVGTAAVKTLVHTWHLAPFPEGLLYSLNYAVSFLFLQRFHLVLATKQPAMTAATLARILRDRHGTERAEEIVDFAALIGRSQLAAAVGNVVAVAAGCWGFTRLWELLTGRSWLPAEEAAAIVRSLSPVDSGTVLYAALTGALLWLASLAGGWLGNWGLYYRLPQAIAEHPLGGRYGRERLGRWGESVRRNLSGWGTNVALGFLLGMTPALGGFLGLPLDVRHVTLNSGILALAAAGLGSGWFLEGLFARAVVGVAVMFTLNLGVSFLLSLLTATRAYGFPVSDAVALLRAAARRAVRFPGDFLLPPRAGRRSE